MCEVKSQSEEQVDAPASNTAERSDNYQRSAVMSFGKEEPTEIVGGQHHAVLEDESQNGGTSHKWLSGDLS
jgi:hypothetical protein